jgi:ectoine hydroxylase-related dioxygenase (phytanoyl-CoA dioxygenase family)
MPGEGVEQAIAVEAPAGSIICWHGNTWHGAFRRRIPGLRLSIGSIFTRPYIWPRHPLREDVTQEILDANPPRFARFCGRHVMTNWREEGPLYGPGVVHAYPTRFH